MKEFAIAYCNWGWLVTCILMFFIGRAAGKKKDLNLLLIACCGAMGLATVMVIIKHLL